MFKSRSKVLFVSAILGILYTIGLISSYVGMNIGLAKVGGGVGGVILTFLVIPHIILIILATLFNILAFFMTSKGFAVAAGVLFCVAALFYMLYVFFVIPMIVLAFVGASKAEDIKSRKIINNHTMLTL